MNKRPTFPLPSSPPAVSSPHFSEQFSPNPAIRYLQKASRPPTPYKLKSFLTTDLRSSGGIWLWSEDFPRQSCSASAFPGEERLVAGLPPRGGPGSRYLRALGPTVVSIREDALGCQESASVHRKGWKITPHSHLIPVPHLALAWSTGEDQVSRTVAVYFGAFQFSFPFPAKHSGERRRTFVEKTCVCVCV